VSKWKESSKTIKISHPSEKCERLAKLQCNFFIDKIFVDIILLRSLQYILKIAVMASGCVTVHNYIVIKFVGYVRKIQMGFRARFLWLVSYSLGFESYISDHHRTSHKDPEGKWRYSSTPLTSALDVSWWSTTHPDRFTRRKETWYPLHRRTGGPQSSLDGCGKFRPHQDLISGPSSP